MWRETTMPATCPRFWHFFLQWFLAGFARAVSSSQGESSSTERSNKKVVTNGEG